MYELEVVEGIRYSKFNDILKIKRKKFDEKGKLFVGDIITIKTKDEVDYLCGDNPKHIVACQIISSPTNEEEIDSIVEKTKLESAISKKRLKE